MDNRPIIDLPAALDRMDGDQDLFLSVAGLLVERSEPDLADLRSALATQDGPLLAAIAHKIKGSALEFCAHPAAAAAKQLEESARRADIHELVPLCERLEAEMRQLTVALETIIAKGLPHEPGGSVENSVDGRSLPGNPSVGA